MDLILWSIADAVGGSGSSQETVGELSQRGHKQARRVAQWLSRHLPAGTRVMTSPAAAALQTAEYLECRFKILAELAPGQGVEPLLHAARWPDARESALVVGHRPQFAQTVPYVLNGSIDPWVIRKGSVCWLRCRQREGRAQILMHAMVTPDLV